MRGGRRCDLWGAFRMVLGGGGGTGGRDVGLVFSLEFVKERGG